MELYLHSTIHISGKLIFPPPLRTTHTCCIYNVFFLTGNFFLVISKSSKADAHPRMSCVAVRTCCGRFATLKAYAIDSFKSCVHCKSKRYVRTSISFMCPVSFPSRDCAVDSHGLRTGRPGFDSRRGQEIFYRVIAFKPALGPSQPPIQWVPGSLPRGHRADYSHLVSRARMVDLYLHGPTRLHGVVLNQLCRRKLFTCTVACSMGTGGKADHSPPSNAEVNGGAMPPLAHTFSWHGA
jgi:hypothetical protein